MRICKADDCDTKTLAASGYSKDHCAKHYMRLKRNGTLELHTYQSKTGLCEIEGCFEKHKSKGMCANHYHSYHHHGDPLKAPRRPVPEIPTYRALHQRLTTQKGKASDLDCVDCGGQAAEWSYNHKDPNEFIQTKLWNENTIKCAYSIDLDYYEPRCKSDHISFDRAA